MVRAMTTTSAAVLRRWFDEIWNRRNVDVVDELLAPDGVLHDAAMSAGSAVAGEQFKSQARALLSAFPDLHFAIDQIVDGGDCAAVRITITGTHSGPGLGVPPTGRAIRISSMSMARVREGLLVEGWDNVDYLGLFAQLGITERPALTPSI
jgi:steroid delta-isomerase-like uncharacterized protein